MKSRFSVLVGVIIIVLLIAQGEKFSSSASSGLPRSEVAYLSPPYFHTPIYPCAGVVVVKGYTLGAEVTIYANDTEVLASGSPWFHWWPFHLNRSLKPSDVLTATQTINGDTSAPTRERDRIIVGNLPGQITDWNRPPVITLPLYTCQQQVQVGKVFEGGLIEVFNAPATPPPIGSDFTPFGAGSVWMPSLTEGDELVAQQSFCEYQYQSPLSDTETVQPLPAQLPKPVINQNALVEGSTVIDVHNLVIGATVDIYEDSTRIGGGVAPGPDVAFPVDTHSAKGHEYYAEQSLCQIKNSSPRVEATDFLGDPDIDEPVCEGSSSLAFTKTAFNSTVKIFYESGDVQIGQGAGTGSRAVLGLGNTTVLHSGEIIYATQEIGALRTRSASVPVQGPMETAEVAIHNGESFFQNSINDPVFLRGRFTTLDYGPVFSLIKCGIDTDDVTVEVTVQITLPNGSTETVVLTQSSLGHFEGGWNWQHAGWQIPDDIPVGKYQAEFRIAQKPVGTKFFYVIFNPAEVSAPAAFSFNDKAIFFRSHPNFDTVDVFTLHLADKEVFGKAIGLVDGETSPRSASEKILKWVSPVQDDVCHGYVIDPLPPGEYFHWSVCTSETDALDLLHRNDHWAQCSDSANLFVAMLRSVGIPSHPVTADSYAECNTAKCNPLDWTYDTWVEVLLNGTWYAVHPHYEKIPDYLGAKTEQYSSQYNAGTTWKVAVEPYNDLILMAGENWPAYSFSSGKEVVQFSRNECDQPNQTLSLESWVDNLSNSYWTVGHWSCPPSPPTPFATPFYIPLPTSLPGPSRPTMTVGLDQVHYLVGDTMHITVSLLNESSNVIDGTLELRIVSDNPLTMIAVDAELTQFTREITIQPARHLEETFDYKLPFDLTSANDYIVIVAFGDLTQQVSFRIEPQYDVRLAVPESALTSQPFTAELTLRNTSNQAIVDIIGTIRVPFSVMVISDKESQSVSSLEPGEQVVLIWELLPQTPDEITSIRIDITSENGGNATIDQGLVILSSEPIERFEPESQPGLVSLP